MFNKMKLQKCIDKLENKYVPMIIDPSISDESLFVLIKQTKNILNRYISGIHHNYYSDHDELNKHWLNLVNIYAQINIHIREAYDMMNWYIYNDELSDELKNKIIKLIIETRKFISPHNLRRLNGIKYLYDVPNISGIFFDPQFQYRLYSYDKGYIGP